MADTFVPSGTISEKPPGKAPSEPSGCEQAARSYYAALNDTLERMHRGENVPLGVPEAEIDAIEELGRVEAVDLGDIEQKLCIALRFALLNTDINDSAWGPKVPLTMLMSALLDLRRMELTRSTEAGR